METLLSFFSNLALLASLAISGGFNDAKDENINYVSSPEVGVAELSPRGETGGYAIPASGTAGGCPVTINPPQPVAGQPYTVTFGTPDFTERLQYMSWQDMTKNTQLISRLTPTSPPQTDGAGSYTFVINYQAELGSQGDPYTFNGTCATNLTVMPLGINLVADYVAASNLNPVVGETVRFEGVIRNAGSGSVTQSFNNTFSINTANPSDVFETFTINPTFGPNQTYSAVSFNTFNTVGERTVYLCADNNPGRIVETDESGSQCAGVLVNVTQTPLTPPASAPTVTLTANPTAVTVGSPSTLTWTVTNNPTSCSATGAWSGAKSVTGGTQSTGNIATAGTYTYTLTCSNAAGSGSATAQVTASSLAASLPNLTSQNLSVPAGPYTAGESRAFTAQVANNGAASTGTGFHDNFTYRWGTTGAWTPLPLPTSDISKAALVAGAVSNDSSGAFTIPAVPAGNPQLYIQHCVDSRGAITESNETVADNCSVSAGITVNNPASAPTVTLTANPTTVNVGSPSTLTWTVTNNPTSCSATGAWSGAKSVTGGTQSTGNIATAGTYTYTLTCSNAAGSGSATAQVTVSASASNLIPALSVTANPTTVLVGATAQINWVVSGGNTPLACVGSGDWSFNRTAIDTNAERQGSEMITYSAPGTYTYNVRCTDNDGDITNDSVSVTANANTGNPSINVNPRVIRPREIVDICWDTGGAPTNACVFEGPDLPPRPTSLTGCLSINPNFSSTYRIDCSGFDDEVELYVVPLIEEN